MDCYIYIYVATFDSVHLSVYIMIIHIILWKKALATYV